MLDAGREVTGFRAGDRVGVPWLGWTCGACDYCRSGRENLCDAAVLTGATRDGGFARHVIADARDRLAIPPAYDDAVAAPASSAPASSSAIGRTGSPARGPASASTASGRPPT